MVIELRDKLNELTSRNQRREIESSVSGGNANRTSGRRVFDDALSALVNLGYQRNAAEKALKQAVQDGTEMSVQKLMRKVCSFWRKVKSK
jgi:Holliday junction resolvasome RuvABC DNA-binding subunit